MTLDDVVVAPALNPAAALGVDVLRQRMKTDPTSLGCASLGAPNHGSLFNGVELTPAEDREVLNPERAWATANTADALERTAHVLSREYPGARLMIGDISRKSGGFLGPHSSHQAGLDADLGYFYSDGAHWYTRARAANLDVERTWALVKALLSEGDVQYVFMDRSVQVLLSDYAATQGADPKWLDALFECRGNRMAVIRHRWGHTTHLHVRFFDETATRLGARLARL
jgi:penicillin-insensitive murein endopeptidase